MKKIASVILSLALLAGLCAFSASAAGSIPAVTDWFAVQESSSPTFTRAQAQKGRIVVNSVTSGTAMPGAAEVVYTKPVDLKNFEVSFSLDNYTKCKDQFLAVGFTNGGNELELSVGTADPHFFLLLRPTDLSTVIDCAQGLVCNYDVDRDMIRVGKSNFAAGVWFEGEVEAAWTNVVFKVCRNEANTGYDVYINGKRINNQNTWDFVDKIESKTGSKDWYFHIWFKDGDYNAVQFTVKTLNGQPAVNTSASGLIQNSLLNDGEKYAAVGGKLGSKVNGGSSTTTSSAPVTSNPATTSSAANTSKPPATPSGTVSETSVADVASEVTESENTDVTPSETGSEITDSGSENAGTESDTPGTDSGENESKPAGGDTASGGSLMWLLYVGIAVVVIAAVLCVWFLVIKKKQAK